MNKCAIVTGSSGGIGNELISALLNEDYFVIGLDINVSNSKKEDYIELETDLYKLSSDEKYRISKLREIKNLIPNNLDKIIIINNAAVQILKDISSIELQDWQKTFYVNTISPFFLVQGLIDELKKSYSSHVINISSIHSKLTKKRFACYAASKSSLESITRSLALELSQYGISVNAIAPAAISTRMLEESFKDNLDKLETLKEYHPTGEIGSPAQLAQLILSITNQKNNFLTGAIIDFSGGISACLLDPQ